MKKRANGLSAISPEKINDFADRAQATKVLRAAVLTVSVWAAVFQTVFAQRDGLDNPSEGGAATMAVSDRESGRATLYTFFVNVVNERFKLPLIGFVNIATGSHRAPQIGFVNLNTGNFSSAQIGFVNTAGSNASGFQAGFINTAAKDMNGFQCGFVNTTAKTFAGLQAGFVNTAANGMEGTQISFVNVTRRLRGLQLGFVNYVDSIEKGMPVGFVSVVQKGGYKAVELGVSDIALFNISYKFGVEKFYTTLGFAYNPFGKGIREQIISADAGFGTVINLKNRFFINPEITSQHTVGKHPQHYISLLPGFGYKITPHSSIIVAPSVVWASADKSVNAPFYSIARHSIDDSNMLYIGARIGWRCSW